MEPQRSVGIDPHRVVRRLLIGLLIAQLVVLIGDLVFNFWDVFGNVSMRRIFNIAREQSIPTWFASLQALGVAVTAWVLGRVSREGGWRWVALFFLYVSIDDAATIHERVGSALDERFSDVAFLADYPSFAWQVVVAPVLAAGLLAVAVYLWFKRPTRNSRLLIISGLAAFAVAQGIDFLEGVDDLFDGMAADIGVGEYTVGHSFRTTEEMLEMLGTLALWSPILWQLADRLKGLRVEFTEDQGEASPLARITESDGNKPEEDLR